MASRSLVWFAAFALATTAVGAANAGQFEDAIAAQKSGDSATAYRLFRSLAESGNVYAQGFIGIMYARGEGVPQNDAEAVKWYRLAADWGNAASQLALARMYETGRGVPQNDVEAATWYLRAAEQGEPWAQTNSCPGHRPTRAAGSGGAGGQGRL